MNTPRLAHCVWPLSPLQGAPESISDSSIEPTAPILSTPGSMSPTNPLDASNSISSGVGMVDSASALSTGMPEPTPLSAKAENDILDAAEKSWNNPPPAEQVATPAVSVVDQAANVVVGTGFGSENQNASTAGSIEVPDNASLSGEMPEPVLAGASSATGPDDQSPSEVSPLNQ